MKLYSHDASTSDYAYSPWRCINIHQNASDWQSAKMSAFIEALTLAADQSSIKSILYLSSTYPIKSYFSGEALVRIFIYIYFVCCIVLYFGFPSFC